MLMQKPGTSSKSTPSAGFSVVVLVVVVVVFGRLVVALPNRLKRAKFGEPNWATCWRGMDAPVSGQFLILPLLSGWPPIMIRLKLFQRYIVRKGWPPIMNRLKHYNVVRRIQLVTLTSCSELWRLLFALTAFTKWAPSGKNRQNSPGNVSQNVHNCLDFYWKKNMQKITLSRCV